MRALGYALLAVGLILAASVTNASAGFAQAAPEISPGSVSAGLALLAGGVLIARARWRK